MDKIAWTKTTPLKTGFHPPEQCARGREDCRSLSQIVSSSGETFTCCGEVLEGASPDPQDRWAFCFRGRQDRAYCFGTDVRFFIDQRDMSHMVAVLNMGLATVIPTDGANHE